MISTFPPPRPVSVNSLARASASTTLPYAKPNRCTSAEIQLPEGPVPSAAVGLVVCHQGPVDTEMEDTDSSPPISVETPQACHSGIRFEDLPIEIHEAILDYLFGERASAFTSCTWGKSARSWNRSLRHPRRKALSNLSLITPVWRELVQDRIYRHIKIKGTADELAASARWFRAHPHLAPFVRHVEIWIPVWGKRAAKHFAQPQHQQQPPSRRFNDEDVGFADPAALQSAIVWDDSDTNHGGGSDYRYHYASHNATLEEMFSHVQTCFPQARILTLEGGHCKRPPMVRHFRDDPCGHSGRRRLPELPDIQTFVMRGAWNIMRDYQHWANMSQALPNVREWHCAYAKPKIEGYETIAEVLLRLSPSLVHVNISLEGFYNKDTSQTGWTHDGITPPHLCRLLGEAAPRLESLAFTGKVCAGLFQATRNAMATRPATNKSRLKSLDLVVKTCCREKKTVAPGLAFLDDFSGITNLNFIRSFEKLVLGAVHSLQLHPRLDAMRIRFIDLDSACPPLNPYFQLLDGQCTGLWSERILETLHEARPEAHYLELSDGIYPQYGHNRQIVGAVYPRTRPLSIHASTYKVIADVSKP
ncbi:uncharacterized protein BO97DRAFT_434934 [Aspergillus homomorphus CBS 101889]|uniref:Uncharacterized protein n=1 Tax=Aspergillus homomorphus (strain CBS 101889) TaxID=1450537 RepID=A0A395HYE9_ASPHC|nr:hypothetical protein BO97DRAFT_434934 [Aspergillus homomorphus CBS 101889]RAL11888.1 hypothetical protein BO97DRAFT_434934 [Aspergillus homomorphus CBS 101889]